MLRKNTKLLSTLAILTIVGSGFATVHAAAANTNKPMSKHQINCSFKKGTGNNSIKTKWDALVTKGTITTDEETAALNLLTPSKDFKKPTGGNFIKTKLDTLVTAKTITADQETAVLNIFTPKATGLQGKHKPTSFKTQLDALVAAKTITADQETAITNLLSFNKGNTDVTKKQHSGNFKKGSTPQVGKQNFTTFIKSKLDTLVTAGTINADQEKAMIDSLTPAAK